ncbi:conserved hypothetical protein [Talaromyces stipitatus ATCC 10500]|uniref:Uncharacterized protein n=1 Tax=Talaromyces stipitatus (strain ATCC 10500 / CBS 375.48 / QM 6759 / NRRL 1006) TaxID=441959 RepID=B8MEA1_TALSN|nr:uncharacterized protein TSTA_016080 [Talaromyces stipitatus ATCC 10500]EED16528.1 conserved hypothetical protein [Talaromyces stipitatus ATCC 10500]
MSQSTKLPTEPVVGATVVSESNGAPRQNNNLQAQSPQNALLTTSPTITSILEATAEFDPHVGAKPCSPFYSHDVNNSLEYLKNESTITAQRYGSNDLESGTPSTPQKRSLEVHGRCRPSKLWRQKKRKCDCLSSLTKRQRLMVKIALALFIVGAMIGIAMGITVAVGGGVWKSANVRGPFGSLLLCSDSQVYGGL